MSSLVPTPSEKLRSIEKALLGRLTQIELSAGDVIVVCAGFEDRATAFLEAISRTSRGFRVIAISYLPAVDENRACEISQWCTRNEVDVSWLTYDRERPAGFGQLLLDESSGYRNLYLDVSAMSRLLVVQLLVAIGRSARSFEACSVLYAEAREYPPTREQVDAEIIRCKQDPTSFVVFLSSGLFEITVVPELSSVAPPGVTARLVAFPSFDASHLLALRSEAQASGYTYIEGVPPDPKNRWRTEAIADLNHLSEMHDVERLRADTLDYRETLDLLLGIYEQHGLYQRILVAPTGSKLQAVAVGLFRAIVRDIQIVYPTPQSFKVRSGYTIGIGPLYQLQLCSFAKAILEEGWPIE